MLDSYVRVLSFNHNRAMTNQAIVPKDIAARYEVHEWRNGLAILSAAHPKEWADSCKSTLCGILHRYDGGCHD
jgi:hypothetical protein